jgi:hypothetical protein
VFIVVFWGLFIMIMRSVTTIAVSAGVVAVSAGGVGVAVSAGGDLIPPATDQKPVRTVKTDTCLTGACSGYLSTACSDPSTPIQITVKTMRKTDHSFRRGEEHYKPTAGLVFQVNRRILRDLGFGLLGEGNYSVRIVSIEDSAVTGMFHRSLGQFANDARNFGFQPVADIRNAIWKFINTNKLKIAKAHLCGIGDFNQDNVFYKNHDENTEFIDENTEFIIVDFDNRLFQPIIPHFIGRLLNNNNINELIDFLNSKQYLDTIDQTLVELRYSEQGIAFFKQHIATAIKSLKNKKFTKANGDEMDKYVVPEVFAINNGYLIPDTRVYQELKSSDWDRQTFENMMFTSC